MRKKILTLIFSVLFIIPSIFLLSACGKEETQIDFRVEGEYIQWTEDGATWTNLIELDDIQGEQGVAGKQVEFQKTSTHIQWRYVGETSWKNLVALEDIKGDDLTAENVKVKFDVNLPEDFEYFTTEVDTLMKQSYSKESQLYTKTITNGDWVELEDFASNEVLKEYFLGWYAGDGINETKFTSFTSIQDNITLTAKWDLERIAEDQIGSSGFTFEGRFSLFATPEGYSVKEYNGADVDVVIPKLVIQENRPHFVKYMIATIIEDDENITSITLPDTMLNVANYTFEDCTNLKYNEYEGIQYLGTKNNPYFALMQPKDKSLAYCNLHNDVQIIGTKAFADTNIGHSLNYIPKNVKAIGDYAFQNCVSMSQITIPKNVEYIGRGVFWGCDSLTNINVDLDNSYFNHGTYRDCIIRNYNGWVGLIAGCSTTKIPNNVDIIYNGAFSHLKMTSIIIPENISSIQLSAFDFCENLTTIIIESNDISNNITSSSSNGHLFDYATTIYIKTGLDTTDSTYLASDYTKQATSDKTGYDMYVKNVE